MTASERPCWMSQPSNSSAYLHNPHNHEFRKPLEEELSTLLEGEKPVHPFHWEIEFPEVFDRQNPGFDAFVGNPPFLGGLKASTTLGKTYIKWLDRRHTSNSWQI